MKYSGALAKPIPRKRSSVFACDESIKADVERIADIQAEKMIQLFSAHGVEVGNWVALSLALAKEHVPGFRIAEPAGRPTEWGEIEKAELRIAVDEMRDSNPGLNISDAIRRIQRMDSWQARTGAMRASALSKHYYAADARWIAIVQDARSWNKLSKGIVS